MPADSRCHDSIGRPSTATGRPRPQRCAAADSPYGPAPTTTVVWRLTPPPTNAGVSGSVRPARRFVHRKALQSTESSTYPSCSAAFWWKRPFDLVIGGGLFLLLLPILLALVLIVRLDSPGPGIYRQRRVG